MASVISIAYLQPRQVEKFEPPIARQRGVCRGHPDDGPLAAERCIPTLFNNKRVARFATIKAVAIRKWQLHAAVALDFLKIPPGNQLEVLKRDRIGQ
jgi:hypothetical protein